MSLLMGGGPCGRRRSQRGCPEVAGWDDKLDGFVDGVLGEAGVAF